MSAEENVRYVATGTPTGWAAMAKTIREVDEDKVKDYKEDIDTLLVFTGLFSAVLTAFVIVSYVSLSPDKQDTAIQQQDTVIKLLGQIASQTNNSTVVVGIMNSTVSSHVPPSSPLPFKPSLAALRVNYLWFASLIVTLITASFSMLVKQWLREYLAYDYTSPHERLRARQFRHPGLVAWKVYEIAGVLPLLLQLALGLFFLGICFFTRSDLHGISDMCAILVAIWASFFVTATIAPFFSPRCPYKTALLKKLAIRVRRLLKPIVIISRRWHRESPIRVGMTIRNGLGVALNAVGPGMPVIDPLESHQAQTQFLEEDEAVQKDTDELALLEEVDASLLDDDLLGTTIYDSLVQYNTEPSRVIKFVRQALTFRLKDGALSQPFERPPDLSRLTKRGWIAVSDIVAATVQKGLGSNIETAGVWLQDAIYLLFSISEQPLTSTAQKALLHCCTRPALPYMIRTLGTSDPNSIRNGRFHGPLAAIPGYISNRRSDATCADILDFIVSYLAVETNQPTPFLPLKSVLDLTERTWQLCSDTLGAMIGNALGLYQNAEEVGPWLEGVIYILLSPSSHPLTSQATKALASLCESNALRQRWAVCMRLLASPDSEYCIQVLSRLGEIRSAITDNPSTEWLLKQIVYGIPCTPQCTHGPSPSLAPLLYEHAPRHLEWTKCYTSILVERCRAIVTERGTWPPGSGESLCALLSLPDAHSSRDPDVSKVLLDIVCSPSSSAASLISLVSIQPTEREWIVSETAVHCLVSLIFNADTEDCRRFIACLHEACSGYLDDELRESHSSFRTLNPVRHVSLASTIHHQVRRDTGLNDAWILYYKACAQAMSTFKAMKYPSLPADEKAETGRIAVECLVKLDEMEPVVEGLMPWEASFDFSPFPDEIFRELVKFVPDVDAVARKCGRVRRLQDIGVLPTRLLHPSHTDELSDEYVGLAELFGERPVTHDDSSPEVANPIPATVTEQAHASTEHSRPVPNTKNDDQQRTSASDAIRSENQIAVSGDEAPSGRAGPSVTAAFEEVHSGATPGGDDVLRAKAESTSDTERANEGRFHGGRISADAPISSGVHDEGGAGEESAGEHAAEVMVGAINQDDSVAKEDQATAPSEGRPLSVKEESIGKGARMDDALTRGTREDLGGQSPLVLEDDGGVGRVSGVERAVGVGVGVEVESMDRTESAVGGDLAQDMTPTDQRRLAQSENAGFDASPPTAPNDEGEPGEGSTFERAESGDRATGETESVAVDDPAGTTGRQHRK